MRRWNREPRLIATGCAFGAACAVAVWSIWRALAIDPMPTVADTPRVTGSRAVQEASLVSVSEVSPDTVAQANEDALAMAVEWDPFHPERRRASVPFRFPDEIEDLEVALAGSLTNASAPEPALRLVGTVVAPSAGGDAFAMCQLGDEPPRVVRTGEQIGDYTLKRIEQGRALFLSPTGETVDVSVPKPEK